MSTYTIKKGKHYHSNILQHMMFLPRKFNESTYQLTFDPSCWYAEEDIPGTKDDADKNKLHGVRYWDDHVNSGAFVWRPNFDKPGYIDIFLYGYENQKRYNPRKPIATIQTGKYIVTGVKIGTYKGQKAYYFNVNGIVWCWIHENPKAWFRRQPYFGGDPVAPWDMFVRMEKVELGDWANESMVVPQRVITTI